MAWRPRPLGIPRNWALPHAYVRQRRQTPGLTSFQFGDPARPVSRLLARRYNARMAGGDGSHWRLRQRPPAGTHEGVPAAAQVGAPFRGKTPAQMQIPVSCWTTPKTKAQRS
jgi:hypothetical protein